MRARGHGAVICDKAQVKASSEMYLPRDFGFSPGVLTLSENEANAGVIVPYDQISALVLATQTIEVSEEQQKTKKKFSATRAIATGGLVRSKKVKTQLRSEQIERESVLYMFCKQEPMEIFFQESRLHYKGLGELMGPTRQKNFASFVELLSRKCPHALFDDSMSRHLRQTSFAASSGVMKSSTTVHSNASQNDLSVRLILLAHVDRQL